jgi:hypothetical protein
MILAPVLIYAGSRTRSNMVGAIFAAHGLWWKSEDEPQRYSYHKLNMFAKEPTEMPPESRYLLFENLEMQDWRFSRNRASSDPDEWAAFVDSIAPHDRRWFWKCGVSNYKLWRKWHPELSGEVRYVLVRRNIGDTVKSRLAKGHSGNVDTNHNHIEHVNVQLDYIRDAHGGMDVNTDEVIHGYWGGLRKAIEYCGIEFDPKATEEAIK